MVDLATGTRFLDKWVSGPSGAAISCRATSLVWVSSPWAAHHPDRPHDQLDIHRVLARSNLLRVIEPETTTGRTTRTYLWKTAAHRHPYGRHAGLAAGPTAISSSAGRSRIRNRARHGSSDRRLPSIAVNPDKSSLGSRQAPTIQIHSRTAPRRSNGRRHPSQTVNAASAPARPNSSALWPISSSDSSISTALMSIFEPQQPGHLSHSNAAAAPVDRFPYRQTLVVSHRPQRLPSPPLSIPDQSIAFTECSQHRDR